MNSIHILPDDVRIPLHPDKPLLQLALDHGIPMAHACGGQGKCSTCRILVLNGEEQCSVRTELEEILATRLGFEARVRLACQTRTCRQLQIRRLVMDPEDEGIATRALGPGGLDAVGEEKQLALLFSDIRNFTTFSQKMLPYDVVHSLNRHYEQAGDIIGRHGGVINNYMGDGFLALFGLRQDGNCCMEAVQAGLEILQSLKKTKDYYRKVYDLDFNIGIGIAYGTVICGEIGHSASKRRTVIGDVVNLASRIESATKQLGTPLLVSEAVRQNSPAEFIWDSIPGVLIPGLPEPLTLYKPALLKHSSIRLEP